MQIEVDVRGEQSLRKRSRTDPHAILIQPIQLREMPSVRNQTSAPLNSSIQNARFHFSGVLPHNGTRFLNFGFVRTLRPMCVLNSSEGIMGEIQGRLLIGGMVLRNLEASLDEGSLDSESGWTGSLLITPPVQESLQLRRPYRLELNDERAGQIEVTHIDCVPGQNKLRVHIRGCTPLKWSPDAHEYHHDSAVTLIPAAIIKDV